MEKKEVKKILISRTDKIGDLILSIPSFYMAKKMFPESELYVLVRNYNKDIIKNINYIDEIISIDDFKEDELINYLKNLNLDIFIALYSDKTVCKIAKKSCAKIRIGPLSKLSSFFSYNYGVFQKRSKSIKNEAEYNLDLIKKIDKKKFEELFEINNKIFLSEENLEKAKKFLNDNNIYNNKIIVIHPFSGGSAKNITIKQYEELILEIKRNFENIAIIITSGVENYLEGENLVKKLGKNVYHYNNKGSILDLAGVINLADIYIGTSTGPTHIAGALGKKIIAIYPIKKTQSIKRWGVYGNTKVIYVLPEGDKEESYGKKEFLSYGEKDKQKIIEYIKLFLEEM